MNLVYKNISIQRIISIVLYFPLAIVFKIFSIKTPHFWVEKIGHLAADPDSFLKEHYLLNGSFPKCVLIAPKNNVANSVMIEYWKKYFLIIQNPFLCKLIAPLSFHPLIKKDEKYSFTWGTASTFSINTKWEGKDALLKIKEKDHISGRKILMKMGLQESDWFVCIHIRSAGYDDPEESHIHTFRNPTNESYLSAIQFIIDQGGKCIRMGDKTMTPMAPMEGLIDYAVSSNKSAFMDIFLTSECLFFLGSASGLSEVANVFGTPTALANLAPLSNCGKTFKDLSIPMLYSKTSNNDYFSFPQIMSSEMGNLRRTEEFENAGVTLIHNTSDEIKDLAIEQFQRVTNTFILNKENETLQQQFKDLFKQGHYSFGYSSRIGEKFLKKHSDLFN